MKRIGAAFLIAEMQGCDKYILCSDNGDVALNGEKVDAGELVLV